MRLSVKLVVVFALVGVVGLWLVNILLMNAIPTPKRLTQGLEVNYSVSDAEFARSLQAFAQLPVASGNALTHLEDGEAIYAAKIAAIENAQYSVTFEVYEFYGDRAAKPMAEALARAAQRGVAVHVLLDFVGSVRADNDWFEMMEDAGVNLHRYHAPSWYNLTNLNYRTHRKIMVIDGRIGFMGGANVGNDWIAEDGFSFRDHHFRIEGPVVSSIQAVFSDNWLNATGVLLEGQRYYPELDEVGDVTLQMVKSSPSEGHHRIRALKLYALAAAEQSFTATTAYFYPDDTFLEAILEARERGVEVRILLSGEEMDKGFVRNAGVNRWRDILAAGVEIYKYDEAMYHAKFLIVDETWSTFGSSNLDNRSFRINDEANLLVWSPDFTRELLDIVEQDMRVASRFTLDDWHQRSWYVRMYGRIASIFGAHY